MSSLSASDFLPYLETGSFGRGDLELHETIGSTNTRARELADRGAPEGTLVISDFQTQGRGRFGRTWHSPAGKNLYMSLVYRPMHLPAHQLPVLALAAGLGAAEALQGLCQTVFTVKWPNDLFHGDRKIAGILVESFNIGRENQFCILGFGLNINIEPDEFPDEVRSTAASLYIATGRPWERAVLLPPLLKGMEDTYGEVTTGRIQEMLDRYRRMSRTIGSAVAFQYGDEVVRGTAEGVDHSGCLLVRRDKDQRLQKVNSGEVTLIKSPPPYVP